MTYEEASSAAVAVAVDVDSTRMWIFALVAALLPVPVDQRQVMKMVVWQSVRPN